MKANSIVWIIVLYAMPGMAAVNFTAMDAGSGKLTIAYTTTDGDLPRGVALRVSLSDGATVDMAAIPIAIVNPAFNTFIDYAYSNPLNFQIGDGHPLAKATEAGALDADASDFSICAGVLDQNGTQCPGPASTTNLFTIQLKNISVAGTTVTISGDTLRGPVSGVVGNVLTSNLPITAEVWNMCGGCLKSTASFYSDWVIWGMPVCWCYERQCRGDLNGKKDGIGRKYYVAGPDLSVFKDAYAKNDEALKLVSNGICGDLNHKADGIGIKYRVSGTDLALFKLYYAKPDEAVPSCFWDDYNFWITP